jgi:predicted nucleic acid-binding protein
MIAGDTSSLVAYLAGETGSDVEAIDTALTAGTLRMPGVVLTEMLSYPKAGPMMAASLAPIPLLDTTDGYWERAGETRRKVLAHGFKARIADALIAQACIDHNIPLIARDTDFRHFVRHCGLVLA